MKKILDFFKSEFPNDAIDIRDGIDLLCQCLDSAAQNINEKASKAFANRDSERISIMMDCVKRIDDMQVNLESYSALLDLDDNVEIVDIAEKEIADSDERKIPNYADYTVDSSIPYSLMEDFTHKRPAAFSLKGNRIDTSDWKYIFVLTCEELVKIDKDIFSQFVLDKIMQGRKVAYFSKDPTGMRKAEHIQGSDVYVTTNLSANNIRNIIQKMLRKYGIPLSEYKIFLKADYTGLHK